MRVEGLRYFDPAPTVSEVPRVFPSPFDDRAHPLAMRAVADLQHALQARPLAELFASAPGKMLGVLVVRDASQRYGFVAGFAGQLQGQWVVPGFVPPLFEPADLADGQQRTAGEYQRLQCSLNTLQGGHRLRRARVTLAGLERLRQSELTRLDAALRRKKQQRAECRSRAQAQTDVETCRALDRESRHDGETRRQRRQAWQRRLDGAYQRLATLEAHCAQRQKHVRAFERVRERRRLDAYRVGTFAPGDDRLSLRHLVDDPSVYPGLGDCAAAKLLGFAQRHALHPVAMTEFWWGPSPTGEVRHHGRCYPCCRSRCGPLLPTMLRGVAVADPPVFHCPAPADAPEIVFEDAALLLVNKPAGMLSVPGKRVTDSVQTRLGTRRPHARGPLLVHRLDMATSGLLLCAKTPAAHKHLQAQFARRQVRKRYVAILSRCPPALQGEIALPLRTDIADRPRQCVCDTHGKAAVTRWQVQTRSAERCRVYFYPHTGRTHQLRVHAAHARGLAAPILGDELYGERANRLYLHAERLQFRHPGSGELLTFTVPAPF